MMCIPTAKKDLFASMYFVGFSFGIVFFNLPDAIGRKGAMWILMPIYILASSLSVLGNLIEYKMVGFFLQGFLHLKIMLSYSHMFELVPKNDKNFCATFINVIDIMTFMIFAGYLLAVSRDFVEYSKIVHYV